VYIPSLGRFLSVDRIEGGTLNSYIYASDPINFFDLSGQDMWSDMGNAIGGAVNNTASFVVNNWQAIAVGTAIGVGCAATAGIGCAIGVGALAGAATSGLDYALKGGSSLGGLANSFVGGAVGGAVSGAIGYGVSKAVGAVGSAINKQFTKHAVDQIAARGGSKLHALVAKKLWQAAWT
jgi:hypothetical protein